MQGGRLSADWMQQTDERILEYLQSEPWATPEEMVDHPAFGVGAGTIRERCLVLVDVEFLAFVVDCDAGMFELAGDGRRYLRGEVDASHRRPSHRPFRA
jgi:hypothetical protein